MHMTCVCDSRQQQQGVHVLEVALRCLQHACHAFVVQRVSIIAVRAWQAHWIAQHPRHAVEALVEGTTDVLQ